MCSSRPLGCCYINISGGPRRLISWALAPREVTPGSGKRSFWEEATRCLGLDWLSLQHSRHPSRHQGPTTGVLTRGGRSQVCNSAHQQPSRSVHLAGLPARAASVPASRLSPPPAGAPSPRSFTQLGPSQPLRLPSGITSSRSPTRMRGWVVVPPRMVLTNLCWDSGVCPRCQDMDFGFRGDYGRHFERPVLNPAWHRTPKSGIAAEK